MSIGLVLYSQVKFSAVSFWADIELKQRLKKIEAKKKGRNLGMIKFKVGKGN
jgi:hypothetical protein